MTTCSAPRRRPRRKKRPRPNVANSHVRTRKPPRVSPAFPIRRPRHPRRRTGGNWLRGWFPIARTRAIRTKTPAPKQRAHNLQLYQKLRYRGRSLRGRRSRGRRPHHRFRPLLQVQTSRVRQQRHPNCRSLRGPHEGWRRRSLRPSLQHSRPQAHRHFQPPSSRVARNRCRRQRQAPFRRRPTSCNHVRSDRRSPLRRRRQRRSWLLRHRQLTFREPFNSADTRRRAPTSLRSFPRKWRNRALR